MKRLIINTITASAVVIGSMAFAAPAANATDTATQPTSGSTITSESSSSSADEAFVTASASIDASANARTLAYIKANGMSKSDSPKKAKSIKLKKRGCYNTSYRNYAGKEVWHNKCYSKGKVFKLGKDGWYHDPNCYNKIVIKGKKLPKKAIIIKGSVKIVKSFKYTATASAKANAYATASAKAWCKNEWNSADAEATATSSAYAFASASASGSTKGSAEASAKSAAKSLALSAGFQSSIKIRVQADAKAAASAKATAKVTCSTGPTTPPSKPKGSIVEIEDINDVLVTNSRTWRVRGVIPDGQTGTLRVSSRIGTVNKSDKEIKLGAGAFDIKIGYTAPAEVGSDTLTVKLYNSAGEVDDEDSDTFEIRDHSTTEPN
jgi:hypothetical protein